MKPFKILTNCSIRFVNWIFFDPHIILVKKATRREAKRVDVKRR